MNCSALRVLAVLLLLSSFSFTLRTRKVTGSPGVVINEFELNPPGDDYAPGAEFAELYNSGSAPVDISGSKVSSTHGIPVTITISPRIGIPTEGFYIVVHTTQWLDNENEQIILRNAVGVEIDRTPVKSDPFNDARTWQRHPDGAAAWYFDTATRNVVNVPEFSTQTLVFVAALLSTVLTLKRMPQRDA